MKVKRDQHLIMNVVMKQNNKCNQKNPTKIRGDLAEVIANFEINLIKALYKKVIYINN